MYDTYHMIVLPDEPTQLRIVSPEFDPHESPTRIGQPDAGRQSKKLVNKSNPHESPTKKPVNRSDPNGARITVKVDLQTIYNH